MRVALALTLLVTAPSRAGEAFGVWKLDPARSSPAGNQRSITLRIERHVRGEVFTLDTVDVDGRASTSSTILYFDGKTRDFQDSACAGTQSSRRLDSRTVEIARKCASGERSQLIRRLDAEPGIMILEVSEQNIGGRRTERRLVLQKQ